MKFLQINDVHASDKPPVNRTDAYTDDIFTKLVEAVTLAYRNQCEFIAVTGDLFHIPKPSRTSHALVRRWLGIIDTWTERGPWLIVAGNHDLAAGRLDSIESQPIGVLAQHAGVALLSYGASEVYSIAGVRVIGIGWDYKMDAEFMKHRMEFEGLDIVLAHAPIAQKSNPFYPTVRPEDIAGMARVICYGHMHAPEPPYEVGGTMFSNPGALARGALSTEDLGRQPQVAIVEVTPKSVSVEYVQLDSARLSSEVFRVEAAQVRKASNEAVTQFVENLGETAVEAVTAESLAEEVERVAKDQKVADLARDILLSV